MRTEPQQTDNQEIDLSIISKKIGKYFDSFLMSIFKGILFLKKNILIIVGLFFLGGILGYFWDNTKQSYISTVNVIPNFESVDHLYFQISLINSKINEGDEAFLKNKVGISDPSVIKELKIKPITDVYKFVSQTESNLNLMKLMAEDGELSKIVDNPITSRNYPNHLITIVSSSKLSKEKDVDPIFKFIESSEYFKKIQNQKKLSLERKINSNDSIISQIDAIVSSFTSQKNSRSSSMVYYNDNTQLNEVIKLKHEIENEQDLLKIEKIKYEKIIKESSATINELSTKALNGKRKLVLPFLFVFLFIGTKIFLQFYNSQLEKYKNQ